MCLEDPLPHGKGVFDGRWKKYDLDDRGLVVSDHATCRGTTILTHAKAVVMGTTLLPHQLKAFWRGTVAQQSMLLLHEFCE